MTGAPGSKPGREPNLRIALGMLGLLLGLAVYGVAVALALPPLIGDWPTLVQLPVYLVLGLIWLLPLKRFLIWMEAGRRS